METNKLKKLSKQDQKKQIFEQCERLLPSWKQALDKLQGADKRRMLGQIALDIGRKNGGVEFVVKYFNSGHMTVRKGIREIETGITCLDATFLRHRTPKEILLPNLMNDIREIIDASSQIDPKFQSERVYTRLSAEEIRNQLIQKKGYTLEELGCVKTIYNKVTALGYKFCKIQKTKPLKKNTGDGSNIGSDTGNK